MNIWRAKRAENFGVTVEENMKMVVFSGQYALFRAKIKKFVAATGRRRRGTMCFIVPIKAPRGK